MDEALAPRRPVGRPLSIAKYDVREEVGHGGMATVYRAVDPRLHRDVALKVIHPHLRDSLEVRHRFASEARAVAKLRHPNIVEVYDVAAEEELEQYLVVEFVHGRSLREVLRARGPMPPEVAALIACEVLSALEHAHVSGVVHRDVKPENVLLQLPAEGVPAVGRDGSDVSVKLTDFGIAKLLDAQGVTSTGQVLGSPAHMAPEQIEGAEVDGRADLFGVGVLLYECMTGRLPFEGQNPAQVLRRVLEGQFVPADQLDPRIGRSWAQLIARALSQNPADRFASAAEMERAIRSELLASGVDDGLPAVRTWLDDPDGAAAALVTRVLPRLLERGFESKRAGRAWEAAACFNRALALSPGDAALMRTVAGLHAAERRAAVLSRIRRWTLRLAPLMLLVGAAATFARMTTGSRSMPLPAATGSGAAIPAPSISSEERTTLASAARDVASGVPSRLPPTTGPAAAGSVNGFAGARPSGAPARALAAPRLVSRAATIASVRPPFGVLVRVDGSAPQEVTAGMRIELDARAHVLTFGCVSDACEPLEKAVRAGGEDENIEVALAVRPALLQVEGSSDRTYQLLEEPTLLVRPGITVRVPMRAGRASFTLLELPTKRRRHVALTAGREARVSFAQPESEQGDLP